MPPCILVVDDESDVRDMLCRMLEQDGYCAVPAEGGRQALERLATLNPALVITDVVMPEVDGYAVLHRLRAQDPVVPALVMSGGGRTGQDIHLEAARRMGAAAVLRKPFTRAEMLDAVHQVLDARSAPETPSQESL